MAIDSRGVLAAPGTVILLISRITQAQALINWGRRLSKRPRAETFVPRSKPQTGHAGGH